MPKRGIDLSTMTVPERTCALAGIGLFINTLIPWWYRVKTPSKTFLHNGGLFGWGIYTASIGFLVVLIAVVRHARVPAANDHSIYATLGFVALALLVVHAARTYDSIWLGYYLEIILAIVLAGAGVWRSRERSRGWI